MTGKKFISIIEASTRFNRPPVSIRRWAREGHVEAIKSGSVWLVNAADIEHKLAVVQITDPSNVWAKPEELLKNTWRRVRAEVKRDDLPDIINYADFDHNIEYEASVLARKLKNNYKIANPQMLEMPKKGLATRPMAKLPIRDRLVYEACVGYLAPELDTRLSSNVHSHRLKDKPSQDQLVRYFGDEYAGFAKAHLSEDEWTHVLITDISSFYEYIDNAKLLNDASFESELKPAHSVLVSMLGQWAGLQPVFGLPQGPTASGILANHYLINIDNLAREKGIEFSRFSDDTRFFFRSELEARRFLPHIVHELRGLGLNLANAKTMIKKKDELLGDAEERRRSDAEYNLESQHLVSIDELRAIFDDSIADKNAINSTDFRFSLHRLGLLRDDYPLEKVFDIIPLSPESAGIIANYLYQFGLEANKPTALFDFLTSPQNIYKWGEIQYLRLIGVLDEVPEEILKRLRANSKNDNSLLGEFSVRTLGAVGEEHDKKLLTDIIKDSDRPSGIRRAAIIGLADILAEDKNKVLAPLLAKVSLPDELRCTAKFVLETELIPPTFMPRKRPYWADKEALHEPHRVDISNLKSIDSSDTAIQW